jgi:hypothetical protein
MTRAQINRFLTIVLAVAVGGCAASSTAPPVALPAAQNHRGTVDFTGVWKGKSIEACELGLLGSQSPGRCNAIEKITFNLKQTGDKLSGTYHCEYGTMVCRDEAHNGHIMYGSVHGDALSITILLPSDGSSCTFIGRYGGEKMTGSYTCYEGGGLVDQGSWQVAQAR